MIQILALPLRNVLGLRQFISLLWASVLIICEMGIIDPFSRVLEKIAFIYAVRKPL